MAPPLSSAAGRKLGVMMSSDEDSLDWLKCLLLLFFSHCVAARLRRKLPLWGVGGAERSDVFDLSFKIN